MWKTIDTAPKTGERILAWDGAEYWVVFWEKRFQSWVTLNYEADNALPRLHHVVYWTPIPELPDG